MWWRCSGFRGLTLKLKKRVGVGVGLRPFSPRPRGSFKADYGGGTVASDPRGLGGGTPCRRWRNLAHVGRRGGFTQTCLSFIFLIWNSWTEYQRIQGESMDLCNKRRWNFIDPEEKRGRHSGKNTYIFYSPVHATSVQFFLSLCFFFKFMKCILIKCM